MQRCSDRIEILETDLTRLQVRVTEQDSRDVLTKVLEKLGSLTKANESHDVDIDELIVQSDSHAARLKAIETQEIDQVLLDIAKKLVHKQVSDHLASSQAGLRSDLESLSQVTLKHSKSLM